MLAVYLLSGGRLELDHAVFFPDRPPGMRWTVPVPCVLVHHPRGRLLFDTGIHPEAITDPVGRLGAARARRFAVRSGPDEEVASQLGRLGLRPDDVGLVANSHFHFDHCGGNELFPRATFLVQRAELVAARAVDPARPGRYAPSVRDFDHPLRYLPVEGEHDVFGDGTVVLLPTPGHTPGHQSLWVELPETGPVILTGDACYTLEHLEAERVPGVVWNPTLAAHAVKRLKTLARLTGARVFPSHDPDFWRTVKQAPDAYR